MKTRVNKRNSRKTRKNQRGGSGIKFIGICGCSGSGKSTLAKKIVEGLVATGVQRDEIALFSTDNYFLALDSTIPPEDLNTELPAGTDLPLLHTHLLAIKAKNPAVPIPKFDMTGNKRFDEPSQVIDGSKVKYVILEGIFAFHEKAIRDMFDLKIFAQLDTDICLARRMIRDRAEYGISEAETIRNWQKFIKPSFSFFIEPTRIYADLTVSTSDLSNQEPVLNMILSALT